MILLYVLLCILLLGVLIAAHEFGHFIVAKKCGCVVHEFAIGMGPLLWSKTKGETKYSLRLLPIGGFCDIEGEGQVSAKEGSSRLLCNMPAWKQVAVFSAGVIMNFIFGFIFILIAYIMRGTPLNEILPSACKLYGVSVSVVFTAIGLLFSGQLAGSDVGGVIGAVSQISTAAAASTESFALIFALMGSISVNLAIMNLLPLPALDGGRIAMVGINKVSMCLFKKPLPEKIQEKAIQVTMVALLALTVILMVKDIFALF